LTFFSDNSIYESHCDFSESQISIREKKFNGCKESCCKEKGCSEKKEVVTRVIRDAQPINSKTAPATEPFCFEASLQGGRVLERPPATEAF
jgi:hypothetical protein